MKTKEVWKSIPDFSNYEISNHARVRNKNTGKILVPLYTGPNKNSLAVNLYLDKQRYLRTISGLVATAFIPNPHNRHCVIHKDGNYENNYPDNLEWGRRKVQQTRKIGKEHPSSKPILQYSKDGSLLNIFDSIIEASKIMEIDQSSISRCCNNKCKTAGGYIWRFKK